MNVALDKQIDIKEIEDLLEATTLTSPSPGPAKEEEEKDEVLKEDEEIDDSEHRRKFRRTWKQRKGDKDYVQDFNRRRRWMREKLYAKEEDGFRKERKFRRPRDHQPEGDEPSQ